MSTGRPEEGHLELCKCEPPFDAKSTDFLDYASNEIKHVPKNDGKRMIINAISHAKRAIDCHIDSLLYAWGLYNVSQKNEWDIPKKISNLKKIGIVIPDTLIKVATLRNNLEHRYQIPKKAEVRESIELARLFINSTYEHFPLVPRMYTNPDGTTFLFDHKHGIITHKTQDGNTNSIDASEDLREYVKAMKLMVEVTKNLRKRNLNSIMPSAVASSA